MNQLPATGFLRLPQIIGNAKKGIQPLIPVSRSCWWEGCRTGKFPKPIKIGKKVTMWRASDIRALIESVGGAS
jgi:predicted DNA-binding transcriptional regulator AlpA